MVSARLSRALQDGDISLEGSGRIGVFNPCAQAVLSDLPRERLHLIQRFRPDHDALHEQGFDVGHTPQGRYATAIVRLPRARALAMALIAEAVAHCDGDIIVDGQKTDGVDAMLRACRASANVDLSVARAHGKLFRFAAHSAEMDGWTARPATVAGGFRTMPGVFSADGPDPGSRLLAEEVRGRLAGRVADLGAGWGFLGARILQDERVSSLDLVEADYVALDCARHNVPDPRARFHWADATRFKADASLDAVVMNPPFHRSRAADPALGGAFIASAARNLAADGVLWMVANRHLPYAAVLDALFQDVTECLASSGFRVYRAARPRTRHGDATPPPRGRKHPARSSRR